MKNILRLVFTVVFIIYCIPAMPVHAVNEEKEQNGTIVTLSGKVPSGLSGVSVSMVLVSADAVTSIGEGGITLSITKDNFAQVVQYVDECLTTSGGRFVFNAYLSDSTGTGQFFLKANNSEYTQAYIDSIHYVSISDYRDAILDLNSVNGNAGLLDTALRAELLGLVSGPAYGDYISLTDRTGVNNAFFSKLNQSPFPCAGDGEVVASIEAINELFNIAVCVTMLNKSANVTELTGAVVKYGTVLKLDTEEYNGTSDDVRQELLALIAKNNFQPPSLQQHFVRLVITAKANKAYSYNEAKVVIQDGANKLGLNLSDVNSAYYKVTDKTEVFIEFFKLMPASSSDDLTAKFNTAAQTALDAQNKSGAGGGSSVTGGRGGGSGASGVPAVSAVMGTNEVVLPPVAAVEGDELFSDIAHLPWAKDGIEGLAEMGVISGVGDGTFMPDENITRAAFIKILIGAAGISTEGCETDLIDVYKEQWYYPYIAAAHSLGIANGTGDGLFGVDMEISRQDAAVFVMRALEVLDKALPNIKADVSFGDGQEISGYAKDSVDALARAEVINGREDGTFDPYAGITRAETAKIVWLVVVALRNL